MFDPQKIKQDFPILNREVKGKPLVYLDNGATSQKPNTVITSLKNFYENYNSNIHRGIHTLAEEATQAYEDTRKIIQEFINAAHTEEIIFTKNTTESINLVAYTWGYNNIEEGDEILVSLFEHHSNYLPWLALATRKKAKLQVIDINDDFTLDFNDLRAKLSSKTKLVALTSISNVTGTINDIPQIIEIIRANSEAKILVDGAQSSGHRPTDVQALDCDFFAFSAHKMLGPTGVGVLYGKKQILEEMPPFLFGGEMVKTVGAGHPAFKELPYKLEAGTPNIADVVAFKEAIFYLDQLGMENIEAHDKELLSYAKEVFSKYPEVTIYSPSEDASAILSFTIKDIHPHDIATVFDSEGIAIRAGLHCAEPLVNKLNVPATARLSFYIYNTKEDIDRAELALQKTIKIFT